MSKRIANCKGRSTARFGRVRYGWRVAEAATSLEAINEKLAQADLEDKLRAHYENSKQTLKAMLPRKLLQRSQGR